MPSITETMRLRRLEERVARLEALLPDSAPAASARDPASMKRAELFRFLKDRGIKASFSTPNDELRRLAAGAQWAAPGR